MSDQNNPIESGTNTEHQPESGAADTPQNPLPAGGPGEIQPNPPASLLGAAARQVLEDDLKAQARVGALLPPATPDAVPGPQPCECRLPTLAFRIGAQEPGENGDRILQQLNDDGEVIYARTVTNAYADKHKPQVGGYWMQHPNGYQDYQPADEFDRNFRIRD